MDNAFENMQSSVGHIAWPPLAGGDAASILALAQQLLVTERLGTAEIEAGQYKQLAALVGYTGKYSGYIAGILEETGLKPEAMVEKTNLQKFPVMSRRLMLTAKDHINCSQLPAEHGPFHETSTSGSTGEPVYITRTGLTSRFWLANTLRDHIWHKRNFLGKLAIIRGNLAPGVNPDQPNWGSPAGLFFKTGTSHILPINTDIAEQVKWLQKTNPDYLITYPNNLSALLDYFEAHNITIPALKQIRCLGETLSPELRQRLKIPISDLYSSQEFGNIAIQCPESSHYHIMAENLIVEVLDKNNQPCQIGETGRVVITDLSNFATPLLRYDIGDYATLGGNCKCGRNLPVLERIIGRERNMIIIGNTRAWPLLRDAQFHKIAPVLQYQVIQKTLNDIEMRLVTAGPLSIEEEENLTRALNQTLKHDFKVQFVYHQGSLPRNPSGKLEDFISEVKYEG